MNRGMRLLTGMLKKQCLQFLAPLYEDLERTALDSQTEVEGEALQMDTVA